jgi:hypothetical protein
MISQLRIGGYTDLARSLACRWLGRLTWRCGRPRPQRTRGCPVTPAYGEAHWPATGRAWNYLQPPSGQSIINTLRTESPGTRGCRTQGRNGILTEEQRPRRNQKRWPTYLACLFAAGALRGREPGARGDELTSSSTSAIDIRHNIVFHHEPDRRPDPEHAGLCQRLRVRHVPLRELLVPLRRHELVPSAVVSRPLLLHPLPDGPEADLLGPGALSPALARLEPGTSLRSLRAPTALA